MVVKPTCALDEDQTSKRAEIQGIGDRAERQTNEDEELNESVASVGPSPGSPV